MAGGLELDDFKVPFNPSHPMKYQKWEEHQGGEQQTEICVYNWDSALADIYAGSVLLKTVQELGFACCWL